MFSYLQYCSSLKPASFSFHNHNKPIIVRDDVYKYSISSSSSSTSGFVCCSSVEKTDSQQQQQYEIDQDKAREALKQLDQQLQSLSQKQVRSPKIKASDVSLTSRKDQKTEEVEEFSGSFLAYTAGALFLLTIFYNVLFYGFIKPGIDGQYDDPTRVMERQITK